MQDAVIAFDVSAIMILIVGGVYYLKTSSGWGLKYNAIGYVMLAGIIAGASDIVRVILCQTEYYGSITWSAFNAIYIICVSLVAPLYAMYVIGITDTWHLLDINKKEKIYAITPIAIAVSLALADVYYPVIYFVGDEGAFIYSWGYYVVNAIIIVYMIMVIKYIFKISRYIEILNEIQLIWPLLALFITMCIQYKYMDQHIVCFGIAIIFLIIILINTRAEESVDATTLMHSYWMFSKDMKLRLITGKKMKLILINIVNYEHALRIAGYDEVVELMRPLSYEMMSVVNGFSKKCMFYNNGGKYAIEVAGATKDEVDEIAVAIVKSINENMKLEVSDFEIKINCCVANCPEDIEDVESLFMLISDLDLFPITHRILSAVEITGTKEFTVKKEMNTILDKAITNDYFSVYYQPIYDVKTGKFASAEALIRLKDPKYGFISPGIFIPLAEKSGMIHKIGSFVIDEVFKFVASDEFKKLEVDYIEVNLSVKQCLRMDLADEIIEKAKKYNVDPKSINLEITETASTYSRDKIYGNVIALSREGFTFSLDDFGTGYSNLMRVTALPLDIIKLDRTFVLLMEKDGFKTTIESVIKMIKDMGKNVLVEGIETKEMVDAFTELGVDEIQGYYFSRPLNKNDYVSFVYKHNILEHEN